MFKSGWSRLGLVLVILVELLLVAGLYDAKLKLDEADQRKANWTVPPPVVESESLTEEFLLNPPPIAEIGRDLAMRQDRMDYELAIGARETATENLKYFVLAIIAFPIIFAVFFYTFAWIVGGFRRQRN